MIEHDATAALPAEGIQPLSGEWWRARPGRGIALAFLAGLLLGWWVLGLWLFPVSWSAAEPYHLRPEVKADYLQLVANDYVANGRLDLAAERLASLGAEDLAALLAATQADPLRSPAEQASLRQLGGNLGKEGYLTLPAATAAATGQGSAGTAAPAAVTGVAAGDDLPAPTGSTEDRLRLLAYAIAVGSMAGLAYIGGTLLFRYLRAASGRRLAADLPSAQGLVREAPGPAVADDLRPRAQTWGADGPSLAADPSLARTQAMPAQLNQSTSAMAAVGGRGAAAEAGERAAASRSLSSRQAPAWRPNRIDMGQTVDARYQEGDNPSILTWLVYGPRGALVGGAGLLAQPIGGVNTLDLWFADRDDVDQTRKTPTVTFISQQAYEDPVLRARLADRRLVPAAPGRRLRLETMDLWLDVEVIAADPAEAGTHPSLRGLVLSLTPHQRLDLAPSRPEGKESEDDDDGGWEAAALDEDIQEAFQPPRPLHFRRD